MCADQTKVPIIFGDDDDDDYSGQLIRGARLKFVEKVWSAADGTPISENDQFLVVGTGHALQRWVDGLPEVITKMPLPDVDTLNEAVPKEQWPIGKFTGQPEPPWKHVRYVYLVRLSDGTVLTHINHTYGTKAAILRLKERIKTMSVLRGSVLPIVKLSWAMMPTGFGPRPRPEFVVDGWRSFGGDQPAQIEQPKTPPEIGKPVEPISVREELNDEIGF
jgi:hypothetical protein